jgi:hypothetical protein
MSERPQVKHGATVYPPKPRTPKAVQAWSDSRERYARIVIFGVVLGFLALAFIAALRWRPDNCKDILLVISNALFFLPGSGSSKRGGK